MKRVVAGSWTTVVVVLALVVVTPSAVAADSCPNAAYRHGAGANLPECRAWEQVSPTAKGGQNVLPVVGANAGSDGRRLFFYSTGDLGGSDGVSYQSAFVGTRSSAWNAVGLDPPLDTPGGSFLLGQSALGTSADQSKALVVSKSDLAPGGVEGHTNLYVRDTADRSYTFVATSPSRALYRELVGLRGPDAFRGANANFTRFVLATFVAVAPGASDQPGQDNLYEASGGEIRLVGRDANEDPVSAQLVKPLSGQHLVSDDGKRVTFVADQIYSAGGLYQHVDGGPTVLISRSHRSGTDQHVAFKTQPDDNGAWASADGTRVTFEADANLTSAESGPFYRWNADGDRLTDLLAGITRPWSSQASAFQLLNVSPDERYLWFKLSDFRSDGTGGHPELWVFDTSTGQLTRKATFPEGSIGIDGPIRFSPDGSRMALMSTVALTGYDNHPPGDACIDASSGLPGPCYEVFAFDAAEPAGTPPVCVSCGGPGTRSVGQPGLGKDAAGLPRPHVVSDSGRIVFDTPQTLSPLDANTVSDVYQYVPGQGRSLLSSGTGTQNAAVADVSASGDDAFFFTPDPLVPQDVDLDMDVYDARVGGGIAAQQIAPAASDPCGGQACRAPQPAAPPAEAPGSSSFQAAPRPPAFSVGRVSASARRSAVASGRLKLSVRVGAKGAVSARAVARVGRRPSTIARASRAAGKAGRFTLTLKLSRAARRALARGSALDVDLSVSYSRAANAATQAFTLARPARSTKGGAR